MLRSRKVITEVKNIKKAVIKMKNELQVTIHDFLIYKDNENDVKVNVLLINKDIWLTQNLIAELFGVARSTITDHINNIRLKFYKKRCEYDKTM